MFGRRRRFPGRGFGGGGGLGLLLLGMQLLNLFNYFSRTNEFLPVTIGVLALNVLAFLQPGHNWPNIQQACISVQNVCFQKEWKRMFFAPFFHSSDFHLYFNMASFIWKGISLEKYFGSGYFLYMIAVFSIGTNLVYLAINYALAEFFDQWSYVRSCAVGFSGVIFALKVVTTHIHPPGMTRVFGFIQVPMRLACWVELVLISLLFPNVSFVGHLSGILVGLAFVSGPLKTLMELPLSFLNGTKALSLPYLQVLLSGEYRSVIILAGFLLLCCLILCLDLLPRGGEERHQQPNGRSYTYMSGATGQRAPDARPEVRPDPGRRRRAEHPRPNYTSYTYASGATGYEASPQAGNGYEASPQAGNAVHEDSEEEGLQEAIRRSLETGPATNRSGDDNTDVQVALERSLVDSQDHNPPNENFVPPPPYNPAFPPTSNTNLSSERDYSDLQSSPTVEAELPSPTPTSLRRRQAREPGPQGGQSRDPGPQGGQSREPGPQGGLSQDELRAARLQRFGSLTQQRSPLDRAHRRSSWK